MADTNHTQQSSDVSAGVKSYLANTMLATGLGAAVGYVLGRIGDNPQRKAGQFFLTLVGGGFGFFLSTYVSKKVDQRQYDFSNAPDEVVRNQSRENAGTEILPGSSVSELTHNGVIEAARAPEMAL